MKTQKNPPFQGGFFDALTRPASYFFLRAVMFLHTAAQTFAPSEPFFGGSHDISRTSEEPSSSGSFTTMPALSYSAVFTRFITIGEHFSSAFSTSLVYDFLFSRMRGLV